MQDEIRFRMKKQELPLVSIITPSYNQGRFIEETILSVKNQKYENIEHIIIDGASTDNTVSILNKYPHLKWISEPDRGQSHAINKGLRLAKGELLAYLNSDDTYCPWTVKIVVEYFSQYQNVDMVYGDCNIINADSQLVGLEKKMPFSYKDLLRYSNYGGGNYIKQPAAFFRKSIQLQVGLFDEQLHYAMDYDYWLRLGRIGKIIYIPIALANARKWALAKTINKEIEMRAEAVQVCRRHLGRGLNLAKIRYFFSWIGHKWMGIFECANSFVFKLLKRIIGETTYNKLRLFYE